MVSASATQGGHKNLNIGDSENFNIFDKFSYTSSKEDIGHCSTKFYAVRLRLFRLYRITHTVFEPPRRMTSLCSSVFDWLWNGVAATCYIALRYGQTYSINLIWLAICANSVRRVYSCTVAVRVKSVIISSTHSHPPSGLSRRHHELGLGVSDRTFRTNRDLHALLHTWRPYWKVTGRLEHCDLLTITYFIMAALRSRCGHYIFALWFLSIFYLFLFLA